MAIYEIETTDIKLTLQALQDASSSGVVEVSSVWTTQGGGQASQTGLFTM